MTAVRKVTDLPARSEFSGGDLLALWQNGRTRTTNLFDLRSFLQQGIKGEQGERGLPGIQGPPGPQGLPGSLSTAESVSIQSANDAVLSLYSAPGAGAFSQKQFISSANVNGGNDLLIRFVRPSDGAIRDFTLPASAAGTIYTTGNLTIGKDFGNVIAYDNFGGARTIVSKDGDGIIFRQPNANGRQYANLRVLRSLDPGCDPGRDADLPGGDPNPDVCFGSIFQTDINESMASFQWNAYSRVNIGANVYRKFAHGDEPVVHGFILDKKGDIPAWNLYSITKDYTSNPVFATLGHERGFQANGPDPNRRRVIEDVQLNSIDDVAGYPKYGNNTIWAYISCGPSLDESERVILERFALVKGRVGRVLDMSATTSYSRENVVFPIDGFMSWRNGPSTSVGYFARIGWNGQQSAFFLDGVTVGDVANSNQKKLRFIINGVAMNLLAETTT